MTPEKRFRKATLKKDTIKKTTLCQFLKFKQAVIVVYTEFLDKYFGCSS